MLGGLLGVPALATAQAPAPAPGWLAPDLLTAADSGGGFAPSVAVTAGGEAVAVWQERVDSASGKPCASVCAGGLTVRIRAAARPKDGPWGAPQTLAEVPLGAPPDVEAPPGPRVAVDPAGTAVAVWEDSSGGLGNVRAAVRPAGGAWGAPENVSGLGLIAGTPSVIVDATGTALAVWEEQGVTDVRVVAAVRPAGGAWAASEEISGPGPGTAMGPQAAFDGAGNALVAWARTDGGEVQAETVERPAGGAWGLPETVSPAGRSVADVRIALAADGSAVAAWGSAGAVETTIRPPGGVWGEPEVVAPAPADGATLGPARVALAPDRTAFVIWQRTLLPMGGTSDFSVWAAVRPPSGPWGPPERLSSDGPGGGTGADLVVDGAGNAVAAWTASAGTFRRIQASARPAGGAWGAAQVLSPPRPDATDVDLDADAARNVVAVWQQGRGLAPTEVVRVRAAIRPPEAPAAVIPGAARCKPLPPPAEGNGDGATPSFELSAAQLRINQRISQAGIRRLNAVIAWLDAGIQGRDLCGGAFGSAEFGPGVVLRRAANAGPEPRLPDPRPIAVAEPGAGGGTPTLSARQLLINQRISQAVVRRANAVEARLAGKLTGGDLAAAALGQAELAPLLRVLEAAPGGDANPSRTVIAPRKPGAGAPIQLTPKQLRINQRISQAGVRRANALIARLEAGLTGAAFANGTITARNLGPELTP
jgi:hypothetical protein